MAAKLNLVDLVSGMKTISTDPESYFQPSKELPNDTMRRLKRLFDFSRQHDRITDNGLCPLKELMVDGFDDEQIWQQIELQNEPLINDTRKKVKDIKKKGLKLRLLPFDIQNECSDDDDDDDENDYENGDDDDGRDERRLGIEFEDTDDEIDALDSNKINDRPMMPASSSEDEGENEMMAEASDDDEIDDNKQQSINPKRKKEKKKKKAQPGGTIVDDKFFKLSEMTEFLDKMDQDFERKRNSKQDDNDEIDYFRDIESDEEEEEEEEIDEDDKEWNNVLGTTAKIMGRDIQKRAKTKSTSELKYSDYFDPPDDEKQEKESDEEFSEDDDDDDVMNDSDDMDDIDDIEKEDNDTDDSINDEEEEMIDDDDDDDEKNNNKESLSKHEKEHLKMEKKIAKLEKENLSTKPWQMSGEAGSTTRPLNSLLEEDLNFDHTTAMAPPITEETTKSVEDIIKQRIKDESWDDVERKKKPVNQPYEYKKKQPLDQEKSKLSLSQIYEREYVKQTQVQEGPKEEEEIEGHKEIKELMTKLFTKLDALSNFHFTPKPLKPEVKIVTNTPVISMEEVAPVIASDAMLLAPEETHNKKVELKGDKEKTDTDRKRERRAKKLKQRLKAKEQMKRKKLVNKLNPGLGNKHAKKKALKSLEKESKSSKNISVIKENAEEGKLRSSSAFFSRLHDEVKQQVNSKKAPGEKKRKKVETTVSKLKL